MSSAPSAPPPRSTSLVGKIFRVVLLLVLLLVAVFLGVGLYVLDGKYEVTRSITIKASPAQVHAYVGDLTQWPHWLPFTKPHHDASVKVTIVQPTGVGAKQQWIGQSGNGELTFTASDEKQGIAFDMLFDKKYASRGAISYTPSGDATQVVWRMSGQNDDLLGKWFAAAMPYMVGPMFDEGLGDLKKLAEAGPPKK